jgi:hypothetical protein
MFLTKMILMLMNNSKNHSITNKEEKTLPKYNFNFQIIAITNI